MTYKYAAAGINLGGGKIVVIGDPKRQEGREMLFRALGRFIDSLGGEYLTGEDVGTTLQDMDYMRVETRNVITLPESAGGAGPIGPATAFGVLQAMRACVEQQSGSPSLRGKRVVVQGLGAVGVPMVEFLVGEGATVLVSDIDPAKVNAMVRAHGATEIAAADVMSADVDVYCPCALGATINDESLAVMKATVVCGSANNQLAEWRHGAWPRSPRSTSGCTRSSPSRKPKGYRHTRLPITWPRCGSTGTRPSSVCTVSIKASASRSEQAQPAAFTQRSQFGNGSEMAKLALFLASRPRRVQGPENEGTSWPTKLNTSGSTAQSRRP
jgi:hypothetical protein